MKKVLVGMLIVGALVTGLVIGSGFVNEVSACEDCNIERIETEEHADCICGSFQLQCENCGGLYCQEYACECGRCEGIIDEANEESIIMSYQEFGIFEEMIWDMFLEDYCTNYCEECDCYYYEICDCEVPCAECNEPVECDFAIFVCDNYDYIMSIADDLLEIIEDMNQQVLVIYEF